MWPLALMTARSTQAPSRKEPTPGCALADALRRAGLTADQNGTTASSHDSGLVTIIAVPAFRMDAVHDHPGGDGGDDDQ